MTVCLATIARTTIVSRARRLVAPVSGIGASVPGHVSRTRRHFRSISYTTLILSERVRPAHALNRASATADRTWPRKRITRTTWPTSRGREGVLIETEHVESYVTVGRHFRAPVVQVMRSHWLGRLFRVVRVPTETASLAARKKEFIRYISTCVYKLPAERDMTILQ